MVDFTEIVSHKKVKERKETVDRSQAPWLQKAQQPTVHPPQSHKHPLKPEFSPLASMHNNKSPDHV